MTGTPHERDRPLLNPRSRRGRRAGVIGLLLVGAAVVAAVVISSLHLHPFGHAGTTATTTTGASGPTGATSAPRPGPRVAINQVAALLAPASRVAAAPFGTDGALFLGGYDAAGAPLDTIESVTGASVQAAGTLPAGEASAVAAALGTGIYLFGGLGSTIFEISPTSDTVVGSLPAPTADAAVAAVGDTAYVIGGFNGSAELNTIVAFTPGTTPTVIATLPVTLRLATAAAVGGEVYIIGGETAGVASSTVYRFDPTAKTVTAFTHLSHARDREAAAALGGHIFVLGGLSTATGLRTRAIYSISPSSGAVHLAGILPLALSDIAATSTAGRIIAAGGINAAGVATTPIYAITVHR
jgi:hypothetical protein